MFDVGSEIFMRQRSRSWLFLSGLRPQQDIVTRQNDLQEIHIVQAALEGGVEEFYHVVAFENAHVYVNCFGDEFHDIFALYMS
mgnify:CR=1 FL=1